MITAACGWCWLSEAAVLTSGSSSSAATGTSSSQSQAPQQYTAQVGNDLVLPCVPPESEGDDICYSVIIQIYRQFLIIKRFHSLRVLMPYIFRFKNLYISGADILDFFTWSKDGAVLHDRSSMALESRFVILGNFSLLYK